MTLEIFSTGVGRCGTRFYRLAASFGSHVVTIPLPVHAQCSWTGYGIVPEKPADRGEKTKVEIPDTQHDNYANLLTGIERSHQRLSPERDRRARS